MMKNIFKDIPYDAVDKYLQEKYDQREDPDYMTDEEIERLEQEVWRNE